MDEDAYPLSPDDLEDISEFMKELIVTFPSGRLNEFSRCILSLNHSLYRGTIKFRTCSLFEEEILEQLICDNAILAFAQMVMSHPALTSKILSLNYKYQDLFNVRLSDYHSD